VVKVITKAGVRVAPESTLKPLFENQVCRHV
jgi:hypothetical protein